MAASRVACASFNIGTNTTITITRDKSSYTHTITWVFGSASGTIATKTAQTNIVWAPNAATLYAQIPNSVSGYGEITCKTYDGNTLIGTTKAGFYAYAVKANCVPAVSGTIEDTNHATIAVTGDKAALVSYISKPKVMLNASPKNSATIKSVQIYNPVGLTATSSPYTFDTVYDKVWRLTAVDSRGFSTVVEKSVDKFIQYDPTYLKQVTMKRKESTSTTAVVSLSGYAFNGSFGAASNTVTVKYRYRTASGTFGGYKTISVTWAADGSFTASAEISNLSLSEQYIFQFVSEDKLTSFVSDDVILGQAVGDLRIGKDYIQSKNTFIVGTKNDEGFNPIRSRRSINSVPHYADIGVSNNNGIASLVLQLYKEVSGSAYRLARLDLRDDGHLYNHHTSMSMAEIMSMSPDMAADGNQGYMILNGGSSTPILIQWGRVVKVPAGANVITSQQITFMMSYSKIPAVFVASTHNNSVELEVNSGMPTKEGATIFIKRANITATGAFWLAIGDGTASLPV